MDGPTPRRSELSAGAEKDPQQRGRRDVIRMVKELNDQRPDQVEVEIPRTVAVIRAMSTKELELAVAQLEAKGY